MRSVLAPAPHPEPTSRLNSVTRDDSFLRNATKWWRNVSDLSSFTFVIQLSSYRFLLQQLFSLQISNSFLKSQVTHY